MTVQAPDRYSLALNFLPLALITIGLLLAANLATGIAGGVGLLVAWIYLGPPLAGRIVTSLFSCPQGTFAMDTRGYRIWWAMTQLQMLFNRLPWLEEILRFVPGLYPLWIAVWGGHVSLFAFVGPGVVITDRHLVRVERGALLGAKAALAGHMATRDEAGRWQVLVAMPVVERDAIMAAESGLGPGARLAAGAMLPTGRRVAPHGTWPRQKPEAEVAQ